MENTQESKLVKNTSGIRPILDRIVVKRKGIKKRSASGIIIPEVVQKTNKALQGEILEKGPEVDQLEVGQLVIWGKHGGTEIVRDGDTFVVMVQDDVIGTIDSYVEDL